MKRIFGVSPNAFFLGLISLLNDFSSEMIYSVMPAFLTAVLGAPAVFVGFIEGFADAVASVMKVVSGRWSDYLQRRKRIAVWGYSLSVATRWFLLFVTGVWQVFILRVIDRVGKGVREAPRDALLTESVEMRDIGKSFGFQRAMDTTGSIIGPAVAIFLLTLSAGDYRRVFAFGFGVGVLALLAFFFVRDVRGKRAGASPATSPGSGMFKVSLSQFTPTFRWYLGILFVFSLGAMPISLLLLKTQAVGLGVAAVPGMYLLYSVVFMLFAIPAGRLSDRVGEIIILFAGFVFAIASYFILAKGDTFPELAGGFMLLGLYAACTDGVSRAYVSRLVPREQLATGQGFLGASLGIATLVAGIAGGLLWTFDPILAFDYGILCMLLGLFTFIRFMRAAKRGIMEIR